VRLSHPFPSLLDGAVTAAIASVAGAAPGRALTLGAAMLALQASIGALNDLADRAADALSKPHKPLAAGLVSTGTARAVVIGGLLVGLVLSAATGVGPFAVAAVGVAIGYLYDLRLKGTAWSWLPFAFGVPLLPIYAWVGAGASLPSAFVVLIPAAVATGAALALGNQIADLARDRISGTASTARRLGPALAWTVMASLYVAVAVLALLSLAALGGRGLGMFVALIGTVCLAAGVVLARARRTSLRERAWETQAVGVGILAAGWLAAIANGGSLVT
jgi:4-hydroxybenzoate polyprenyltransferase